MSSKKKKFKVTSKIKHYPDVDIASLVEGSDKQVDEMLGEGRAKVRITTMLDVDVLTELKRRATTEADGRYQTYLNQLLREILILKKPLNEEAIAEVVKSLVKASALKVKKKA